MSHKCDDDVSLPQVAFEQCGVEVCVAVGEELAQVLEVLRVDVRLHLLQLDLLRRDAEEALVVQAALQHVSEIMTRLGGLASVMRSSSADTVHFRFSSSSDHET